MTFGAPVPAFRLETWKVVGWKCSFPWSRSDGVDGIHREVRVGDVPLNPVHGKPA